MPNELHSDLAYRIITEAEQLSPIAQHRFVRSVQRHYEQMNPFPEGFLVLGDALCTFNPINAQGMSAAAKQAKILQPRPCSLGAGQHYIRSPDGQIEGVASLSFTS